MYEEDYLGYFQEKPLDLKVTYLEFYVLEYLGYLLQKILQAEGAIPLPSTERLLQDFSNFVALFNKRFAFVLADYLWRACFGEARHSLGSICSATLAVDEEDMQRYSDRKTAWRMASNYNPAQVMPVIFKLFSDYRWNGAYGGKRWADIARAWIRWQVGEINDATFIDHVADLEHNCGTVFSKGITTSLLANALNRKIYSLNSLLDVKRNYDLLRYSNYNYSTISLPIYRLYLRIRDKLSDRSDLIDFIPLRWESEGAVYSFLSLVPSGLFDFSYGTKTAEISSSSYYHEKDAAAAEEEEEDDDDYFEEDEDDDSDDNDEDEQDASEKPAKLPFVSVEITPFGSKTEEFSDTFTGYKVTSYSFKV